MVRSLVDALLPVTSTGMGPEMLPFQVFHVHFDAQATASERI